MNKASYTLPPPPPACREGVSRFLKLLPIATFLAAGFAPSAHATMCGGAPYTGPGPCSGSSTTPTVTVDSDVTGDVYGLEGSPASNATVTMTGGTVEYDLHGGRSSEGDANENEVHMTGGTVKFAVYGGRSQASKSVNVNKNKVSITGGSPLSGVYGGRLTVGYAIGNKVTISGVTVGGDVSGASTTFGGYATENKVYISNSTLRSFLYGGYIGLSGSAVGNEVDIKDSTVDSDAVGGFVNKGSNSTDNRVTITDSTVKGEVTGGYVGGSGKVSANRVTISGSTVNSHVFGGQCRSNNCSSGGSGTHNIVTLAGTGTVKGGVWGARCTLNPCTSGDWVSGNTLIVDKAIDFSVGSVESFAALEFVLPTDIAGKIVLKVGGDANFSDTTAFKISGTPALKAGERVTLIDAGGDAVFHPKNPDRHRQRP